MDLGSLFWNPYAPLWRHVEFRWDITDMINRLIYWHHVVTGGCCCYRCCWESSALEGAAAGLGLPVVIFWSMQCPRLDGFLYSRFFYISMVVSMVLSFFSMFLLWFFSLSWLVKLLSHATRNPRLVPGLARTQRLRSCMRSRRLRRRWH